MLKTAENSETPKTTKTAETIKTVRFAEEYCWNTARSLRNTAGIRLVLVGIRLEYGSFA
ncbi:MAG: hypothetical protein P4L81_00425 [Candidatus Pacebacteria bacterium]|nr:hypothetical protein [Candidatus Paceibacterota bacterium]